MYKLLVVEDEEVIRFGIIRSIPWHELGFEVIGQVANGKEGLEFVRQNKPDVILTDVRMPLMNGLTMAEQVLKLHPEIKVIILSGFADFEYAQKAIRFKAFDYLLKPTDKNKFFQCFKNLKAALDEEQERMREHAAKQEKRYQSLVHERESFLLKLIDGSIPVGTLLSDTLESLELSFSGSAFAVGVILLETDRPVPDTETAELFSLLRATCATMLPGFLRNGLGALALVRNMHEIVMVFNSKSDACKNAVPMLKKSATILERELGKYEAHAFAAIGLSYPELYQISKSYEQAKLCLENRFYDGKTRFYSYSETDTPASHHAQQWIDAYPKEANEIIDAVLNGSPEAVQITVDKMYDRFEKMSIPPDIVREYSCFLCYMLHSACMGLEEKEHLPILQAGYDTAVKGSKSILLLRGLLKGIFTETAAVIRTGKSSSGGKEIIENVKRYIRKNYATDISLEKLSRDLFISPSYLSYLFKLISGESYSDYLKNTRLNKARELLESEPELKVYEICDQVGYKEYKYFSIQFKNTFGLSPTEVRKYNKGALSS